MLQRDVVAERVRTGLRFVRRLEPGDPTEPFPPALPDGRVVNVTGRGEMFVREVPDGDGPAIVLLHGWTLTADLNWFGGGYDVAARHGRVLAPDLRGHGRGLRSEQPFTLEAAADDLADLLCTCEATPAVLVGYSMGGSVAMLCAQRHPELVAGLVLASCGLQWRGTLWERVVWLAMGGAEYVFRFGRPEGIVNRYLRYAVEQSADLEEYVGWVKAESRRGDASDIGHAATALAGFDMRDVAGDLDLPAAVVVTCRDVLIRPDRQRKLAEALDAHVVEVDGHHDAWLVKPDVWSAALDEAIDSVVSRISNTGAGPAEPAGRLRGRSQSPASASA